MSYIGATVSHFLKTSVIISIILPNNNSFIFTSPVLYIFLSFLFLFSHKYDFSYKIPILQALTISRIYQRKKEKKKSIFVQLISHLFTLSWVKWVYVSTNNSRTLHSNKVFHRQYFFFLQTCVLKKNIIIISTTTTTAAKLIWNNSKAATKKKEKQGKKLKKKRAYNFV